MSRYNLIYLTFNQNPIKAIPSCYIEHPRSSISYANNQPFQSFFFGCQLGYVGVHLRELREQLA